MYVCFIKKVNIQKIQLFWILHHKNVKLVLVIVLSMIDNNEAHKNNTPNITVTKMKNKEVQQQQNKKCTLNICHKKLSVIERNIIITCSAFK